MFFVFNSHRFSWKYMNPSRMRPMYWVIQEDRLDSRALGSILSRSINQLSETRRRKLDTTLPSFPRRRGDSLTIKKWKLRRPKMADITKMHYIQKSTYILISNFNLSPKIKVVLVPLWNFFFTIRPHFNWLLSSAFLILVCVILKTVHDAILIAEVPAFFSFLFRFIRSIFQ